MSISIPVLGVPPVFKTGMQAAAFNFPLLFSIPSFGVIGSDSNGATIYNKSSEVAISFRPSGQNTKMMPLHHQREFMVLAGVIETPS